MPQLVRHVLEVGHSLGHRMFGGGDVHREGVQDHGSATVLKRLPDEIGKSRPVVPRCDRTVIHHEAVPRCKMVEERLLHIRRPALARVAGSSRAVADDDIVSGEIPRRQRRHVGANLDPEPAARLVHFLEQRGGLSPAVRVRAAEEQQADRGAGRRVRGRRWRGRVVGTLQLP